VLKCKPLSREIESARVFNEIEYSTYLISNAIKYSPPKPAIQIACVKVDGKAIFSICDQGIGIRKEDLPKLFERYYRVQESKTKNISGFGVGLYLCYEIIM
jgi:signal transduction histidine kinase